MSYLQHCKVCLLSKCYFLGVTRVSIVTMFVQPAFQNLDRVFREVTATLPHGVTPSWMAVTSGLVWPSSRPTDLVLDLRTRVLLIRAAGRHKSLPCCCNTKQTPQLIMLTRHKQPHLLPLSCSVSVSRMSLTAGFDPNGERTTHLRWFYTYKEWEKINSTTTYFQHF